MVFLPQYSRVLGSQTCATTPSFPEPVYKEAVYSSVYVLGSFVENQTALAVWVYFWVFYFIPLVQMSLIPCCFCCNGCMVHFEVKHCGSSSVALFAQDFLASCGLLCFHRNLRVTFSSSVENDSGILMGIAFNLEISFSNMAILTNNTNDLMIH